MGHTHFDTAWGEGAALSADETIAFARPVITGD
jgi:hypothetical protein